MRSLQTDQYPLLLELQAARKRLSSDKIKRRKAEEAKRAEEDNLQRAQLNGEMNECPFCCDEFPMNRMVCCDGGVVHFVCTTCMGKAIEADMSLGKCRPRCYADTQCKGLHTRQQIMNILEEGSFNRLERMQQQEDLLAAGLQLDECPFCDFKMQCPPAEIDKEFRCIDPRCMKVSCRLCLKESHIPKSCAEAKADAKITVRHQVEEAMTEAIVRKCNRCKNPFIKEAGCNKMHCSKCGNLQCYVCSKDIKDYSHFADSVAPHAGSKCPLHDNVEQRHQDEAKRAEEQVRMGSDSFPRSWKARLSFLALMMKSFGGMTKAINCFIS
jgi:E3 ubiquitin-protein ligase RNF216